MLIIYATSYFSFSTLKIIFIFKIFSKEILFLCCFMLIIKK
ncbi:hypothetical protein D083_2361 [Dickeya solani RNS 08.23.3.1.A]|nr:hypothetical protein D083_2361 [Dickeya solani RNS 08.23.3.1.A]